MKKDRYTAIVNLPIKSAHTHSLINKCMYELQHKEIVLIKLHDDPDYDFVDLNIYYFINGKWVIKKATKERVAVLHKKRISKEAGVYGCMWRSEWLTDITKLTKRSNS